MNRQIGMAAWLLVLTGVLTTGALEDFDAGFLASKDQAPDGCERLRAAGPIVELQIGPDGRSFHALRPVTSAWQMPDASRSGRDILWPLGSIKRFRGETFWRFLNIYGTDSDPEPDSRGRVVVFPLVFAGRDKAGDTYGAVFPIGGTIHEYFGQDRLGFVLFPLYGFNAQNDLRTHHVLWPIYARTQGPGVSRVRVFPLYGRSVRENRWDKRFVLWPIWTSTRYTYPDSNGGGFLLFPVFGHAREGDKESWTVFPPLFRRAVGPTQRELRAPWPFIRIDRGKVNQTAVWPLWGTRTQDNLTTGFFLWPLGYRERMQRKDHTLSRFMLLPFIQTERVDEPKTNGSTVVRSRHWKLWPLVSTRREPDAARVRVLALWPLKHTVPIERNLAPLWSLYTHTRTETTTEDELLWGLWRRRSNADGSGRFSLFPLLAVERDAERDRRHVSALLGLVRVEREGWRKRVRLLYFLSFGDRLPEPDGKAATQP